MTQAIQPKKKNIRKILLILLAVLLAVAVALGCVVLFVPGFWHPIGFFPRYSGILDSPIEEITLSRRGDSVTFSDEDLIAQWQEGLEQLQLQKTQTNLLITVSDGDRDGVTISTETGEYYLSLLNDRIYLSCFVFTPNDSDNLPLEETFAAARQRHGLDEPA